MTPDVISVHEAGHAFCAVALGHAVLRVQVGDSPCSVLSPRRGIPPRLDRIRILAAGGAAEEVVFDRAPVGTGTDDERIANLLTTDDDEGALRADVRRLIELNAGTVKYLAAKLARAGMLRGDEVRAIVRGQPNPHR
jgi:hypothetical protein